MRGGNVTHAGLVPIGTMVGLGTIVPKTPATSAASMCLCGGLYSFLVSGYQLPNVGNHALRL